MNNITQIDILVGIKAEQSLRDAVRLESELSDTDIELTPVGKKDWIAGVRIGSNIKTADLLATCKEIHKKLMNLNSEQRIRFESIRLYVVRPPVPVFKDPIHNEKEDSITDTVEPEKKDINVIEETEEVQEAEKKNEDASVCPVCKRAVHPYNLHYDTDNNVVGCFMCEGNSF